MLAFSPRSQSSKTFGHCNSKTSELLRNSLPDLIADPNFNLAAGSAVVGTISGGLEDVVKKASKPLGLALGALAVVFTLFGGFIAFQVNSL